jgi:hypothetical protein
MLKESDTIVVHYVDGVETRYSVAKIVDDGDGQLVILEYDGAENAEPGNLLVLELIEKGGSRGWLCSHEYEIGEPIAKSHNFGDGAAWPAWRARAAPLD